MQPEIETEPWIERTPSEQLRQAADQVHTTRQESSLLAVRTKGQCEAVTTLRQGLGIRTIARQLGLARETVRRFDYASRADKLLGAPRAGKPTLLEEFAVHLHERSGHTSAAALYEELRALE